MPRQQCEGNASSMYEWKRHLWRLESGCDNVGAACTAQMRAVPLFGNASFVEAATKSKLPNGGIFWGV